MKTTLHKSIFWERFSLNRLPNFSFLSSIYFLHILLKWKLNIKIFINLTWGHFGSKIQKRSLRGKFKVNVLHRDHPPARKLIGLFYSISGNIFEKNSSTVSQFFPLISGEKFNLSCLKMIKWWGSKWNGELFGLECQDKEPRSSYVNYNAINTVLNLYFTYLRH